MNAVIKLGGKQYLVSEGTVIYAEKLNASAGDTITIDEVLMVNDKIGNPYVAGASVVGTVVKNGKSKKIVVYKYKQKSNKSNRLKQGHRQPYTKIEITKING